MQTPTYKEQFDKLTRAYINGEVQRLHSCSCFIGNMMNNTGAWSYLRCASSIVGEFFMAKNPIRLDPEYQFYTMQEVVNLENNFMEISGRYYKQEDEEDALFAAFESTLELLKQIHISKGEIIDQTPIFTKRSLKQTSCAQ